MEGKEFDCLTPTLDHGTWRLQSSTLQLVLKSSPGAQVIDLERCNDSAQILDWICHYSGRLADQELADLVRALDRILDPRANACGLGRNQAFDSSAIAKAYARKAKEKQP